MKTRIETLVVELEALSENFKRELATSQSKTQDWGRSVKRNIGVGTLALTAATTATAALTKQTITMADSIAKNARAAGLSAETYQAWEFAASQAGVTTEKFASSIERATKRIGEAARGTGEARKVLAQLGIQIRDNDGNLRSTETILREFADAMQAIESPAERSAAAAAVLGREGIRLSLLFSQGADGLEKFEQKARDLGLVINGSILKEAEEASDQLDIMQRIIGARLITSMSRLFPVVISAGNAFASATPKVIEFADAFLNLVTNSEKAQISNSVNAARERIKFVQISLDQIREAELAAGDDEFTRKRLALARKNAELEIAEMQKIIEDKVQQLTDFERNARARTADLIDSEAALLGSFSEGGDAGNDAEIKKAEFRILRMNALHTKQLIDQEAREIEAADTRQQKLEEQAKKHFQETIKREKKEAEERLKVEREIRDGKLQIVEDVFSIGAALAQEDSKAQRVLLAAQKAAALARSVVALQEAIAKANALGFPANIPAIAQATAIGAGAIASIRSVQISGAAHGGLDNVPEESTYLLQRGERVVSPKQNRDLTEFLADGRNSQPQLSVIINEAPGSNPKTVTQEQGPDGRLMIMIDERVRNVFRADVASGRGIANDLQQAFNVSRRATR